MPSESPPMKRTTLRAAILLACLAAAPLAYAETAFDTLRTSIFGPKPIFDGHGIVTMSVPARPDDIRAVPFTVDAAFKDGRTVKAVTFVVDNNPSPVIAAFRFPAGRDHVGLALKFRLNQGSEARAVVEASDGKLYMVHDAVKFPGGQAACSAPPATPPAETAANMGKMKLAEVRAAGATASTTTPRMRFEFSHPNHTGMVMDQVTLLYTPLKMVDHVVVKQGSEPVFEMDGSIGLNENPVIEFDYARNGAGSMSILATDTDGSRFEHAFPLGPSS